MSEPHEFDFLYGGLTVGFFREPERPNKSGRYRYMPYRSGGHYKLHDALHAGERPRCVFRAAPHVSFAVLSCPQYGELELSDFMVEDRAANTLPPLE
jgi:hypothetical protein